jgi:hypothetical protein
MRTSTLANALETDPADQIKATPTRTIVKRITFASATQTLGTVPANSLILSRRVIRLTKWDAVTAFEIGKQGDTDWLMTTGQANVTGNIPAGEDAGVEEVSGTKAVTSATDIVLTLNQGAATAGVGYVIVEYQELVR